MIENILQVIECSDSQAVICEECEQDLNKADLLRKNCLRAREYFHSPIPKVFLKLDDRHDNVSNFIKGPIESDTEKEQDEIVFKEENSESFTEVEASKSDLYEIPNELIVIIDECVAPAKPIASTKKAPKTPAPEVEASISGHRAKLRVKPTLNHNPKRKMPKLVTLDIIISCDLCMWTGGIQASLDHFRVSRSRT